MFICFYFKIYVKEGANGILLETELFTEFLVLGMFCYVYMTLGSAVQFLIPFLKM